MPDILRPILEFAVIIPGLLLAYLPMKEHYRVRPVKIFVRMFPLAVFLCTAAGILCYMLKARTLWAMPAVILIIGIGYLHSLNISRWKSVNVLLAICAVYTWLSNLARASDLAAASGNGSPWFSFRALLLYHLLCWAFTLLAWFPADRVADTLLNDENIAQTWYVFWILPLTFIGLNFFINPIYPENMKYGRIMLIYIVISIAILILMLLFYTLFYLMARSLNRNVRLQQENQFLSMQQTQYDNLQTAIEETRQVRHDMRHHIHTLSSLAERGEWDTLKTYLAKAQKSIPEAGLNLCDNPAIDGVAGHYGMLYRKNNIPFSMELDLPSPLPVSEMDFCLVLSNLLENALEASLRTSPAKRQIKVQACPHSDQILLLTVKNTYEGTVTEKNGIFQSSKRRGSGVGLQSVRRIAEKGGGCCRFTHDGETFTANIMLRKKSPDA